jgi:hypothetical protein
MFGDRLDDGFRAVFQTEVLHVDRRSDQVLAEFVDGLSSELALLQRKSSTVELLQLAVEAVQKAFGGTGRQSGLEAQVDERLARSGQAPPQDLPICRLMGDFDGGRSWKLRSGVGTSRHRAILLKYVCDNVDALVAAKCQCAMLQGPLAESSAEAAAVEKEEPQVERMWNIARIGDGASEETPGCRMFLVDCMEPPGQPLR